MIVPTRVSCGRSGSFGLGTAIAFEVIAGVTAGAGGRREGENIGRSRVTANCESGMAHSGLPLSVRSTAGAGCGEGGAVICTTDGADSVSPETAGCFDFTP